jgi:hypothetical protein
MYNVWGNIGIWGILSTQENFPQKDNFVKFDWPTHNFPAEKNFEVEKLKIFNF